MQSNRFILVALALVLIATSLQASMIKKMTLDEMVDRAGSIYRGKVMSVSKGTVMAGGAELPTVTYRIQVSEEFKGEFEGKGEAKYTEVTMLAAPRDKGLDEVERFSKLPPLPELRVGGDYLLLTTARSNLGLSTTVGLGQGAFAINQISKQDFATNELGNLGLYDGPVSYEVLAVDIRAALGQ